MTGPNMISPTNLMRQIGLPDSPVILDVRIADDIAPEGQSIPSAIFYNFNDIDGITEKISGRKVIVVCHKGLKLSQGVAALIRAQGGAAEVLTGGFVAWQEAALTTVPISLIPTNHRWVTRQRPKIDRIVCPWLITRFIAPQARFMFVPRGDVTAVADKFEATAFDTADAAFSHRGDNCSFDALLDDFNLQTDALVRMANIIRAADTNKHNVAPQAAGLLAISVGLSKIHRDDNTMLAAGLTVYDALYRWARDGFEESHTE